MTVVSLLKVRHHRCAPQNLSNKNASICRWQHSHAEIKYYPSACGRLLICSAVMTRLPDMRVDSSYARFTEIWPWSSAPRMPAPKNTLPSLGRAAQTQARTDCDAQSQSRRRAGLLTVQAGCTPAIDATLILMIDISYRNHSCTLEHDIQHQMSSQTSSNTSTCCRFLGKLSKGNWQHATKRRWVIPRLDV